MSNRRKKNINDVSDEVFKQVIEHLESGGTKKRACEMIGVSSNATMERMIEEWKDSQVFSAEMRKKKRGTPIEGVELANVIEAYLRGDSYEAIAERTFRSVGKIKTVLEQAGALLRIQGTPDPLNPPLIPDESVREEFEVGEHVWIPGYQCIGEIMKVMDNPVGCYRVYLLDEGMQQYVHVMNYNIASVKHLETLGANIKSLGYKWSREDTYTILTATMAAVRKRVAEEKR